MIQKFVLILCALIFSSNVYGAVKSQEIEVSRSSYKTDQYKYYVVEVTKNSNIYDVSIKRVSPTAIVFLKKRIQCSPRAYKELGSSVKSASSIKANYSGAWYKPTIGSINLDIITAVCR